MNLTDIVSITGRPGLYKVFAQTPKRIIVESLDEQKKKLPVAANFQVAMLDKITIFTQDGSDLGLAEIFASMHKSEADKPALKGTPAELRAYFKEVAPTHDEERVYTSDIKKILKWYQILDGEGLITLEEEADTAEDSKEDTSESESDEQ